MRKKTSKAAKSSSPKKSVASKKTERSKSREGTAGRTGAKAKPKAATKGTTRADKPGLKTSATARGKSASKPASKSPSKPTAGRSAAKAGSPARKATHAQATPSTTPRPDKRRRDEAIAAAEAAIEAALDKKALAPILIDVADQATYTDFIGIVSGRSDRQVDAIADHVSQVMKQRGWQLLGREGAGNGRWTLLDFGDVVLHVFYHPVREVYDIEGLWIDAPRLPLKDVPPEAMHFQPDALYAIS